MSSPTVNHLTTPSPSDFDHLCTPAPIDTPMAPTSRPFGVDALINHFEHDDSSSREDEPSPPGTTLGSPIPAHQPWPTPTTPLAPTGNVDRPAKDRWIWNKRTPESPFSFRPFEFEGDLAILSDKERKEMADCFKKFQVQTSDGEGRGLISEYSRRIPYSSDKKGSMNKTNRNALETCAYVFTMPGGEKEWPVMWDYQIGLTRTTPFFRALGHSKTTPAKALNSTPGLKDLSISITGGSIGAQGYWIPYRCARALCLTFCWELRWILVPIFGPNFPRECLHPSDPGFEKFKLSPDIIRAAQRDAKAYSATPPSKHPASNAATKATPIQPPQSAPNPSYSHGRPWERPTFAEGSPFDETPPRRQLRSSTIRQSPEVSPKSVSGGSRTCRAKTPGWATASDSSYSTPTTEHCVSHDGPSPLKVLIQSFDVNSWRPIEGYRADAQPNIRPTGNAASTAKSCTGKRRRRSSTTDSNTSPEPDNLRRMRLHPTTAHSRLTNSNQGQYALQDESSQQCRYTAEDIEAAHNLLNIKRDDDRLARRF